MSWPSPVLPTDLGREGTEGCSVCSPETLACTCCLQTAFPTPLCQPQGDTVSCVLMSYDYLGRPFSPGHSLESPSSSLAGGSVSASLHLPILKKPTLSGPELPMLTSPGFLTNEGLSCIWCTESHLHLHKVPRGHLHASVLKPPMRHPRAVTQASAGGPSCDPLDFMTMKIS